jgi:hypothetical protein
LQKLFFQQCQRIICWSSKFHAGFDITFPDMSYHFAFPCCLLFVLGCSHSTGTSSVVLPAPGPVAFYAFDGNTVDSNVNANNGIPTNATYVADRFGNVGNAVHLEGANASVSIADAPQLDFGSQTDFTICGWVNFDSVGNEMEPLLSKLSASPLQGFEISYTSYLGGAFIADMNVGTNTGQEATDWTPQFNYAQRWHFFVFVATRGDEYLNYASDAPSEYGKINGSLGGNINTNAPLILGGGTNANAFRGSLDEIRIYNRALSTMEIDSLYHLNGW